MEPLSSKIPPPAAGDAARGAAAPEREKKLRKACADFEAMLAFQMFKTMRQTVPQGGLIRPSQGKATYEMMLDQKVAEELSRKGEGLGLQRVLYEQLSRPVQKKD